MQKQTGKLPKASFCLFNDVDGTQGVSLCPNAINLSKKKTKRKKIKNNLKNQCNKNFFYRSFDRPHLCSGAHNVQKGI